MLSISYICLIHPACDNNYCKYCIYLIIYFTVSIIHLNYLHQVRHVFGPWCWFVCLSVGWAQAEWIALWVKIKRSNIWNECFAELHSKAQKNTPTPSHNLAGRGNTARFCVNSDRMYVKQTQRPSAFSIVVRLTE